MKRSVRPDGTGADAARLGAELREARMGLGWSIEDVAARLRIRRVYLQALEDGRVRDLPSPAYAIGFARNYAGNLGLDPDELVRRFRDAVQGTAPKKGAELVFPEPVPERGFPAGIVVLLGGVLAVGAYAAWYSWSGNGNRVADAVPPAPPAAEQLARVGDVPRPPITVPNAPPPPAPLPATGLSGAGAPPAPPAAPAGGQPGPAAASPPVPANGAAPAQAADASRIVIRVRNESWTQVRDPANGQVLLNRNLRPGETFPVPNDRRGLLLTTGRAEATELLVEGQPAQFMTGLSGVRRDIPLDAERLRQPAPPAPRPPPPRPAPQPAPPQ